MQQSRVTILRNTGAAVVLLATIAIGGWLIWSQLISSGRDKVIYLPKAYRSAGPTPAPPTFNGNARVGRGLTNITIAGGGRPAAPPTAAEIATFFSELRNNDIPGAEAMLNRNPLLAKSRNTDSATPLHIAPSVELTQMLLADGANVDETDGLHNDPPIRWHARDRSISITSVLFSHGAKLQTDIFFVSAISLTDQTQLKKIIAGDPSLIESRSRPNDILGGQATPLLVGALWDRLEVVRTLLDAGAKVDDVIGGKSGASALHLAAWNDDPDMIKLLLDHGASIESASLSPQGSPLTWAVMRGGRKSVQALIDRNALVTGALVDLASRGVRGTDPANLPGKPADYSYIAGLLRDRLSAPATTAPATPAATTAPTTGPDSRL